MVARRRRRARDRRRRSAGSSSSTSAGAGSSSPRCRSRCVPRAALRSCCRDRRVRDHRGSFDWAGAVTLVGAATALLFALNRGPEWGGAAPVVLTGFVATPVARRLFVIAERRAGRAAAPARVPATAQLRLPDRHPGHSPTSPTWAASSSRRRCWQQPVRLQARATSASRDRPAAGVLAHGADRRLPRRARRGAVGRRHGHASPSSGRCWLFAARPRARRLLIVIGALRSRASGSASSSPSIAASVANAVRRGIARRRQRRAAGHHPDRRRGRHPGDGDHPGGPAPRRRGRRRSTTPTSSAPASACRHRVRCLHHELRPGREGPGEVRSPLTAA